MKAIVTGGAGFIGSHIVDRLLGDGHEVIVIDNESATSNEQFHWNNKSQNHKLDITEYDQIRPLFEGVDVVFHLAAESRIQPAIHNPLHAAKVNFLGTCTVLQCAREAEVERVIYSSTSSGYGLKNKPPLREDMSNDCLNPYSVTKCGGEDLCNMYYNLYGLKTINLRYLNVYGNRQPLRGEYAPVVGLFLRQAAANSPMTIVGDGSQTRDFTSVLDVVEANMLATRVDIPEAFGEVYNIGTGKRYSIIDVARMIGTEWIHIDGRPGEATDSLADISKSRRVLGYNPTSSLKQWIHEEITAPTQ